MSAVEPTGDYSVGRVADLAGVTVRTLHHYDEIGLVRPHGRSPAGYRRYSGNSPRHR
jgi:DNA-binding transcriptional MerR regulator